MSFDRRAMTEYGLIGKKLEHSFSQRYFREKFNRLSIDADYLNFQLSDSTHIPAILNRPSLGGLNVTLPYKEAVLPFLDELTEEAAAIGAVNTIQFSAASKIGHNTDVYGFQQLISPFLQPHHDRAVVLGTGGSAKAVTYALRQRGIPVVHLSRTPRAAQRTYAYSDVDQHFIDAHLLVVNCTPVGLYPNVEASPDLPYRYLSTRHLVVDLIYNPSETLFLKKAAAQGAVALNGMTMLEQQAEQSWRIWNATPLPAT